MDDGRLEGHTQLSEAGCCSELGEIRIRSRSMMMMVRVRGGELRLLCEWLGPLQVSGIRGILPRARCEYLSQVYHVTVSDVDDESES